MMDKFLILVICDTAHEAKDLMKAATILIKDEELINTDYKKLIIETTDNTLKFVNKYDFSNGQLNGLRPDSWMTGPEFIELMEEGLNETSE